MASRVQIVGQDTASVIIGVPTEGNLLVVCAFGRDGVSSTSHTVSGSGWNKVIERDTELLDTNARRALSVWYKFAGFDENDTISVTGASVRTVVSEYAAGGGEVLAYVGSVSNDNGTLTAESISTGTLSSAPANCLLIAFMGGRQGATAMAEPFTWTGDVAGTSWNSGSGAANGRLISSHWAVAASSGNKSATWDNDDLGGDALGLSAGLLAFSTSSGSPPQVAYPDADVTTTGWTPTPLWQQLDETSASDSDFITATAV